MKRVLNHIRGNIVGYLALFVALGGTSYAAVSLPAGSVGTQQLRNGAVTGRKLANHSVAAASLDPKSIAGHIVAWAQIRSGKLVYSSPHANVTALPAPGHALVTWQRRIPPNCIAITNATEAGPFGPTVAYAFGPGEYAHGSAGFEVQTFDGTNSDVPENFNIVVICP